MSSRSRVRTCTLLVCFFAHCDVSSSSSISDQRRIYTKAVQALRSGQASEAQALLVQLEQQYPGCASSSLLKGHCKLMVEKDRAAAEELYRQAKRKASGREDDAEAEYAFGRLHRLAEQWDQADKHYTHALALMPDNAELEQEHLFVRGKKALVGPRPQAALLPLARGLGKANAQWRKHFARELAHALGFSGQVDAAAQQYEEALQLGVCPGIRSLASRSACNPSSSCLFVDSSCCLTHCRHPLADMPPPLVPRTQLGTVVIVPRLICSVACALLYSFLLRTCVVRSFLPYLSPTHLSTPFPARTHTITHALDAL